MTMRRFVGTISTIKTATLITVEYDLGFGVYTKMDTHLIHPSTHETLYVKEKGYGVTSREFVSKWRTHNMMVDIDVLCYDRQHAYGVITSSNDRHNPDVPVDTPVRSLNQLLIEEGYIIEETDKRTSRLIVPSDMDTKVKPLALVDPFTDDTQWQMPRKSF